MPMYMPSPCLRGCTEAIPAPSGAYARWATRQWLATYPPSGRNGRPSPAQRSTPPAIE
jgi:hypothetical protein